MIYINKNEIILLNKLTIYMLNIKIVKIFIKIINKYINV